MKNLIDRVDSELDSELVIATKSTNLSHFLVDICNRCLQFSQMRQAPHRTTPFYSTANAIRFYRFEY